MAAVSSSRQAGRDMQPSQSAIEREFEALRDIRRRSSAQGGPGALLLDPDLPTQGPATTPPLSPQAWAEGEDIKASPTSKSGDGSSSSGHSHDSGEALADDPFYLFWVPAHLHPELAPSEFRAFLKEHAHGPAEGTAGSSTVSLSRASSSASGLGRKRSMLSRQYKPRDNDGVEEEERVVPLRRNKSVYGDEGPRLTISDLQKLEELAEEDPTKLRKVIRRSLSLNVAPSFLDQDDDGPDTGDDADAPIIVPRPNQILRRTARTKIRKPGLSGDGGGHRFPATRRTGGRAATVDVPATTLREETVSLRDGHEPSRRPPKPKHKEEEEEEPVDDRRMTYTEESLIYDAYADTPDEKEAPPSEARPQAATPTMVVERSPSPPPPVPPAPPISETVPAVQPVTQAVPQPTASQPILHQPQPLRHLSPNVQQQPQPPSRTPSPEAPSQPISFDEQIRPESRTSVTSDAYSHAGTSPSATEKRKEKNKKSIWSKVGGSSDKSSKKASKDKESREKEKDSGFFGSLFGSKKKHEDHPPSNLGGGAGPATAAAMLGASKSKPYTPSVSPQLGNPYARYPIHVERAIYRLSHIKLANPRRPLYEQVLISNLMFWYLGVINKTQQGPGAQDQNQQGQTQNQSHPNGAPVGQVPGANGAHAPTAAEKEQRDREQHEREEREKAERERTEKEKEQRERVESRREPRRGSLTKAAAGGVGGPGGRRAEMPVKNPQYGLQSQVIEQEYRPSPINVGPALSRTSSAPSPGGVAPQSYTGGYQVRPQSQPPKQPLGGSGYSQPDGNSNYYYGRSGSVDLGGSKPPRSTSPSRSPPSATGLPPGAMPPLSTNEQLWLASMSPPSQTNSTSPRMSSASSASQSYGQDNDSQRSPPRQARSPPRNQYSNHDWSRSGEYESSGGAKLPNRSLSANAAVPSNPGYNANTLKKKAPSAIAASEHRRQRTMSEGGEEEDVPLAIWQQQRRK